MQRTRLSQHTAFLEAARDGDLDTLDKAFRAGNINVNIQDMDGTTALIAAVLKNHPACVERILAHMDTDVNLQDTDGWTALIYAACNGRDKCVKLLLAAKDIDVKLQTKRGNTASVLAVRRRHAECVKLLATHTYTHSYARRLLDSRLN